jgi:hypothetical protein
MVFDGYGELEETFSKPISVGRGTNQELPNIGEMPLAGE